MAAEAATIHASAVLVGNKAALIRGSAGSGKSQLVWDLLQAAAQGALPFARLVADDRAHIETRAGRLLVRPAPALAGMIEIRGLGICHLAYEPLPRSPWWWTWRPRMPPGTRTRKPVEPSLAGISLPRLAVAAGMPALPMVLAFLQGSPADN